MRAAPLTVAPGGPKMHRDRACENPDRPLSPNSWRFVGGIHTATAAAQKDLSCGTWAEAMVNGRYVTVFHGFTMPLLASLYSGSGGKPPVVDRTQLQGAYDFTISVRVRESGSGALTREQREDLRAQSWRTTQQNFRRQLGLRIDFGKLVKMPVPVLVIDHVEKPRPN